MPELPEDESAYYTLVPEQGLCRLDDAIINLRKVSVIRKLEGKTLVYHSGAAEPIIFPVKAFDQIRDAVFAMDDDELEEDFEEDDFDADDE